MNVNKFLQKWTGLGKTSKIDFSKLQMRYADGHEASVYSTKNLGGGVMMQTMQ